MPRRPPPTFEARPRRLLVAGLLAVLAVSLAAGLAAAALSAAAAARAPVLLAGVPAGLLVMGAMAIELAAAWRLWRSPDAGLTIGPEGLWDRRVSAAPIPWAALRWRRVTRSTKRAAMDAVRFDLDPAALAGVHGSVRLLAAINRLAGLLPYSVAPVGLDRTTPQIAEACARYKPPEAP